MLGRSGDSVSNPIAPDGTRDTRKNLRAPTVLAMADSWEEKGTAATRQAKGWIRC